MTLTPTKSLKRMIDEMEFILHQTNNLSYKDFENNAILQRAIIRSFEVIGEAAKQLPFSFKDMYSHVVWIDLVESKEKLLHQYFDIDVKLIYDICVSKIQTLQKEIHTILLLEEDAMSHS